MTQQASEDRFRQAAEAENGMAASVGARVAHVRLAVQAGHALLVDLAQVPDESRPGVIAAIKELVDRASTRDPHDRTQRVSGPANPSG